MRVVHITHEVAIVPVFCHAGRHERVELNSRVVQDQCKPTQLSEDYAKLLLSWKGITDNQIKGKYILKWKEQK